MHYARHMEKAWTACTQRRNAWLFAAFLLMYAFVNATISLRMGLHWDEMADIDAGNTGDYVAAGRWGLALYRLLFGEGAFPLLAPVAGGLYICAALVWQVRLLRLQGIFPAIFYGGIYLSSVQWAYQLEYSHQCDALGLGVLAVTAGVASICRKRSFAGVLAVVFGVAVYQSLLFYAAALLVVLHLAEGDARARRLLWGGACLVLACMVYFALNAIALQLPWVSPQEVAQQRWYQIGMSRWSEYPVGAGLGEQCHFLGYYGIRFAKMTAKNMLGLAYAGQWVFATVLFPLGALLSDYVRRGRRVHAFLLLVVWWLPFCMILPTLSDQGARVSMAEPLALAGIWGLWLRERGLSRTARRLLAVLLCAALLKSAYRVADIAVNEYYVYRTNLDCVREMHTRAVSMAECAGQPGAPILLVGNPPLDPEVTWTRRECLGSRGYMPPKILFRYCRFMHIPDMRYATPEETETYRADYLQMPTWPAAGSVRHAGNAIIIRID